MIRHQAPAGKVTPVAARPDAQGTPTTVTPAPEPEGAMAVQPDRRKRRLARTRTHHWRSWAWRAGLMRGEWWVGVRYDFAADAWVIGMFGAVLLVTHG